MYIICIWHSFLIRDFSLRLKQEQHDGAFHTHDFWITCTICSLFMAFHRLRRVSLVKQKLLTVSVYNNLYLWISFCSIYRILFRSLFLLLYFFLFRHCVVCRFTVSDYPFKFDIVKLFVGACPCPLRSSQSTNLADFTNRF